MLPAIQMKVLLSIVFFKQRKLKEARKILFEAAHFAAPEYCIRPFLDYGSRLEPLLSWILHSESLATGVQAFLKGLLTILRNTSEFQQPFSSEEAADLSIAASISSREKEILQLLSLGLSNREIANRCCISVSTAKTHIENIYRKLSVNSRLQAITEGQKLNLI